MKNKIFFCIQLLLCSAFTANGQYLYSAFEHWEKYENETIYRDIDSALMNIPNVRVVFLESRSDQIIQDQDKDGFDDRIYQLRNLEYLILTSLNIKKMPDISMFSNLRFLQLDGMPLDTIEINKLPTSLEYIIIASCKIRAIPDNISLLTKLRIVDFESNKITAIPTSLATLDSLYYINLNRNPLQALPDQLPVSLQSLTIAGAYITHLPKNIGKLPKLNFLKIDGCGIERFPKGFPSHKMNGLSYDCDQLHLLSKKEKKRLQKYIVNFYCSGLPAERWLEYGQTNTHLKSLW